jgi:hypothetical protein
MRLAPVFLLAIAIGLCAWDLAPAAQAVPAAGVRQLPERLQDGEFWRLVTDLSETGGAYHSDNFTSNEPSVADVAAELAATPRKGAYLGVGPEQNFTYLVAVRPPLAFIVDIRWQAVVQHLLFKALFELSADRAGFLARLFAKVRPDGPADLPIQEIWDAMGSGPSTDRERHDKNRAEVVRHLTVTHGFALTPDDLTSLDYVYDAFFKLGPGINAAGYQPKLSTGNMNFMKLSVATDRAKKPRSFLGSEEAFQYVKSLQERNLIVPVQGDFAGPRTIRAIGAYLRERGVPVGVFYISNVEQYLFGQTIAPATDVNGGWRAFYDNLATLPIEASSVLVRSSSGMWPAICGIPKFLKLVAAGAVRTQSDARRCGQ